MPRAKFLCAYCDKSFEDSQDARKRHFSGRNHRANVKLWYDSFADKEQQRGASHAGAANVSQWATAAAPTAVELSAAQPTTAWQQLPPSMIPAPPDAFRQRRRLAEWG